MPYNLHKVRDSLVTIGASSVALYLTKTIDTGSRFHVTELTRPTTNTNLILIYTGVIGKRMANV